MDNLKRLAQILEVSAASLVADEPDYAHTVDEKLSMQIMREMTDEQREAYLAVGKAMIGTTPKHK